MMKKSRDWTYLSNNCVVACRNWVKFDVKPPFLLSPFDAFLSCLLCTLVHLYLESTTVVLVLRWRWMNWSLLSFWSNNFPRFLPGIFIQYSSVQFWFGYCTKPKMRKVHILYMSLMGFRTPCPTQQVLIFPRVFRLLRLFFVTKNCKLSSFDAKDKYHLKYLLITYKPISGNE